MVTGNRNASEESVNNSTFMLFLVGPPQRCLCISPGEQMANMEGEKQRGISKGALPSRGCHKNEFKTWFGWFGEHCRKEAICGVKCTHREAGAHASGKGRKTRKGKQGVSQCSSIFSSHSHIGGTDQARNAARIVTTGGILADPQAEALNLPDT